MELLDAPLDYLSLSKSSCKSFNSSTFLPLARWPWTISVIHLEISNSATCLFAQLEEIGDYTFRLFTNLKKLIISKHLLSHLSQHAFNGLAKLQELDLSNNRISVLPQHIFDVFTKGTLSNVFTKGTLKFLDLSNNLITMNVIRQDLFDIFTVLSLEKFNIGSNIIYKSFYWKCDLLQNLAVINIEHANITPFAVDGKNTVYIAVESGSLLKLQLARNKAETGKVYLDGINIFMRNPNLQYIDLSNWLLLDNFLVYFGNTTNLTYLDVSGSNIYDHIQSTVCYPYLETFKLMRNRINTTQEIAFLQAPSLTTLDLSHNWITNIHSEYVATLNKLINLNLEDNRLQSLNWYNNFKELQQINIAHNFLSAISKTFLTQIKQLKVLNASSNLYDCSSNTTCLLEPFQDWILQDTFTLLQVSHSYHCYFKQNLSFGITSSVSSVNLDYCKYLIPIYICASFVGLLFIAMVVFLLVKYHWHIRYKLFLLFHQRFYQRPLDDEGEEGDRGENIQEMRHLGPIHYRRYDCYVAYARQNEDWVNDELVHNIEDYEPEPFALCMKERGDIPPGRFLLSSICHGIMHSRRTLIVLSEHFMADGMCDFQLHIAHNRLIKEGRDVLILVFLEEIPDAKKTLLLRQILCTNRTVLKWPQDPLGKDLFWRRLREELKRPVRIDRRFEA